MSERSFNSIKNQDDFIDFKKLFTICLKEKFFILIFTLFGAIGTVFYALSLPNIYQSSALLAPSTSNQSLSNQLASFSSIASMAGINIPNSEASKSQEAIKRIQSLEFFSNHFLPNIKVQDLIAAKDWLSDNDIVIYDENLFDSSTEKWKSSKSSQPSAQDAYKVYIKHLNIAEDLKTSFITVSMKHYSPNVAKEWLELIIESINESIRDADKEVALNSVEYLRNYLAATNIQSMKDSVSSLLESQMQTLMIASSSKDYVFKIIDPPFVPEQKSEPSRAIICILGTILFFFIASFGVIFREFYNQSKTQDL